METTRQPPVRVLGQAPADLSRGGLRRVGEGIGKVVYASEGWVVKRERHTSEMLALIAIWRTVRRWERYLPKIIGRNLLQRPSTQLRLLRVLAQGVVLVVPRGVWLRSHLGEVLETYRSRDERGESLAMQYLAGTALVPEQITFPPTRVRIAGWPGWMVVSEATERVECTLHERINELARARQFDEIGVWLERLLDLRQAGWQRGVFSLDAHLKNFGVTANRVVLIDAGGLTNNWAEIQDRLQFEDDILRPHAQLGLEHTLRDRPDIAERFDARWREIVNPEVVRRHWPQVA